MEEMSEVEWSGSRSRSRSCVQGSFFNVATLRFKLRLSSASSRKSLSELLVRCPTLLSVATEANRGCCAMSVFVRNQFASQKCPWLHPLLQPRSRMPRRSRQSTLRMRSIAQSSPLGSCQLQPERCCEHGREKMRKRSDRRFPLRRSLT
jgi:hypothetical protein